MYSMSDLLVLLRTAKGMPLNMSFPASTCRSTIPNSRISSRKCPNRCWTSATASIPSEGSQMEAKHTEKMLLTVPQWKSSTTSWKDCAAAAWAPSVLYRAFPQAAAIQTSTYKLWE